MCRCLTWSATHMRTDSFAPSRLISSPCRDFVARHHQCRNCGWRRACLLTAGSHLQCHQGGKGHYRRRSFSGLVAFSTHQARIRSGPPRVVCTCVSVRVAVTPSPPPRWLTPDTLAGYNTMRCLWLLSPPLPTPHTTSPSTPDPTPSSSFQHPPPLLSPKAGIPSRSPAPPISPQQQHQNQRVRARLLS